MINVVKNRLSPENLAYLLKGANLIHISTVTGWTAVVVGSGGSLQEMTRNVVTTGTTVSSSARLSCVIAGLSQGVGPSGYNINWDKKLYLILNYSRAISDSEAIGRVQLKVGNSLGALGDKGIGLRIDNLALVGESYGTALGEVNFDIPLTAGKDKQIVIIHYPGSKIEWYVDRVLKGIQSTAAAIPSGTPDVVSYLVHSINKSGAVTTGDAESLIYAPKIWQER